MPTVYAEDEVRTIGQHDGAKVALFLGDKLICILRDDIPTIPYPNMWDLPGGGREGSETPFETAVREVQEELGLTLPREAIIWEAQFRTDHKPNAWVGFFVAQMPAETVDKVIFGDEGQRWALFRMNAFIGLSNRVPSYVSRLVRWQKETGGLQPR